MTTKDQMTEVNRFKVGSTPAPQEHPLRATRFWLGIVMAGLILSGVTAFPLETELHFFLILLQSSALRPFAELTHLLPWISRVYSAFRKYKPALSASGLWHRRLRSPRHRGGLYRAVP
jgi:hypothetical protein